MKAADPSSAFPPLPSALLGLATPGSTHPPPPSQTEILSANTCTHQQTEAARGLSEGDLLLGFFETYVGGRSFCGEEVSAGRSPLCGGSGSGSGSMRAFDPQLQCISAREGAFTDAGAHRLLLPGSKRHFLWVEVILCVIKTVTLKYVWEFVALPVYVGSLWSRRQCGPLPAAVTGSLGRAKARTVRFLWRFLCLQTKQ